MHIINDCLMQMKKTSTKGKSVESAPSLKRSRLKDLRGDIEMKKLISEQEQEQGQFELEMERKKIELEFEKKKSMRTKISDANSRERGPAFRR